MYYYSFSRIRQNSADLVEFVLRNKVTSTLTLNNWARYVDKINKQNLT